MARNLPGPAFDAELSRLWDEGMTTAKIGKALGVTKNVIVGRSHRIGCPPRPNPIKRKYETGTVRRSPPRIAAQIQPLKSMEREVAVQIVEIPPIITPRVIAHLPPPPVIPFRPPPSPYRTCQWPFGEPGQRDFHFCGDASAPGRPYCEAHANIAYARVRDRREDAA